jgi:hypothetical protein
VNVDVGAQGMGLLGEDLDGLKTCHVESVNDGGCSEMVMKTDNLMHLTSMVHTSNPTHARPPLHSSGYQGTTTHPIP